MLLLLAGPWLIGLAFRWWGLPLAAVGLCVFAAGHPWCSPTERCDESAVVYAAPVVVVGLLFAFGGAVLRAGCERPAPGASSAHPHAR